MFKDSPFASKSGLTSRSPTKQATDTPTVHNTRSKTARQNDNTQVPRPIKIEVTDDLPSTKTNDRTPTTPTIQTPHTPQPTNITNTRNTQHLNKMNPQQIHQSVTSLVPEFSGDETDPAQTATSLAKFLGASDNIYNRLETNDEKEEFNGIIKYRLTGTAFTRIHRRRIKDYPTLKTTLKKMYNPVYSLTELENNYMRIRQQYGESIKSYGYRLSEALDLYKIGYRSKYELANLDDTYTNHLHASSVEIFKRGLT